MHRAEKGCFQARHSFTKGYRICLYHLALSHMHRDEKGCFQARHFFTKGYRIFLYHHALPHMHRDEKGGFNSGAMQHTREDGEMLRKTEVGRAIGRWVNGVRKVGACVRACCLAQFVVLIHTVRAIC
jgi:hypothetical protein